MRASCKTGEPDTGRGQSFAIGRVGVCRGQSGLTQRSAVSRIKIYDYTKRPAARLIG